jgi:hypothetical protein
MPSKPLSSTGVAVQKCPKFCPVKGKSWIWWSLSRNSPHWSAHLKLNIVKNVWTIKCCTIQNKITVCTYDEYNIEYPFIIKVNIIFWKLLTSETFLPDLDPKPVGTSQMLQAGVHFHLLLSAQNLLQLCVEVHCVYPQWIFFQPKMFC